MATFCKLTWVVWRHQMVAACCLTAQRPNLRHISSRVGCQLSPAGLHLTLMLRQQTQMMRLHTSLHCRFGRIVVVLVMHAVRQAGLGRRDHKQHFRLLPPTMLSPCRSASTCQLTYA